MNRGRKREALTEKHDLCVIVIWLLLYVGASWWVPMRNSNAFVGNLCTINLPCSVSMTQISLISKRHSLNTACMDALTHPCKGPTSGLQTFILPYPPKYSLLRDSPQVMSLTKKLTCIFVFSQSHT